MIKNIEQAIREAAYYNWQNAGMPQGQDEYFWAMAVEQVSKGNCNKSSCKSSSAKKTACAKKSTSSSCKTASKTTAKKSSK